MALEKKVQKESTRNESGKDSAREGKPITVHAWSGYKRDESPRSFELDGKKLTVLSVKKTWQSEAAEGRHRKTFFRVHAHDGRSYDLALDPGTGEWTLEPWSG